jgi:hypothetical protein
MDLLTQEPKDGRSLDRDSRVVTVHLGDSSRDIKWNANQPDAGQPSTVAHTERLSPLQCRQLWAFAFGKWEMR